MEILWLALVALMITAYVVLDGFDLGSGALHLWVAKTDSERRSVLRAIGPYWDGNEVWLLAGGGILYFAFPKLYASSFSGFYLPLMIVLWLLIGRAVAVELRSHVDSPLWKPFWDAIFCVASALLCIFFGAALGNVVRGVPLEEGGYFFLPLWTDFGFGPQGLHAPLSGILDWYTILVGLLAFATLLQHGAWWLALKTHDPVAERARTLAKRLWWSVLVLVVLTTLATFSIQPQLSRNFQTRPWGAVFPLLALAGLGGLWWAGRRRADKAAFLASCLYIVGMLTSAAFGIFPYVLPCNTNPDLGLTVYNTVASEYGLRVGLFWWIPGMALTVGYFIYLYRKFAGKVDLAEPGY